MPFPSALFNCAIKCKAFAFFFFVAMYELIHFYPVQMPFYIVQRIYSIKWLKDQIHNLFHCNFEGDAGHITIYASNLWISH